MAANGTLPSGWALVARAAENAKLGEAVFIVALTRKHVNEPGVILTEMKNAVNIYCLKGMEQVQGIYIAHGNEAVIALAAEKYDMTLQEFEGDEQVGLPETAYYFQPLKLPNPFFDASDPHAVGRNTTRCYILAEDNQIENATDDVGQSALRQEMLHWSYNDQGKPQPFGGIVLDCVRMILYNFWLTATALTDSERRYAQLPAHLQPEAVRSKLGSEDFVATYMAQQMELGRIHEQEREREREEQAARPRGLRARFIKPRR
jgi:hypothetical protein